MSDELKWTSEFPKVPGYYWLRYVVDSNDSISDLVKLVKTLGDSLMIFHVGSDHIKYEGDYESGKKVEWKGPIAIYGSLIDVERRQ